MKIESIALRFNKLFRKKFAFIRIKKLRTKDFTIISNNCWGGMVYESYNLQKKTPTVGLYFKSSDYIKFIENLEYYLNKKIQFIKPMQSKYYNQMSSEELSGSFPIGKLDDIEIFFLHYKNEKEVLKKWYNRIDRINFENIIFKFNDQNGCSLDDIKKFVNLPYKNKLFFTIKEWEINSNCIYKFNQLINRECINASKEPFGANKVLNVNNYINNIQKENYFTKNRKEKKEND